jgi:hypothetical protein
MRKQRRTPRRARWGAASMTGLFSLCSAFLLFMNPQLMGRTPPDKRPLIVFHIDFNSVSLRKDYIEKWLRKTAAMGYNAILWEVEDMVKWETCPECASPDAFSKKEFKELLAYSRRLGLEPIPLLQTIGHAEYVLRHKKYVPFREKPNRYDCYCSSNPEVRKFMKRWIEEYRELFGEIRYFHLGGDEAYVFGTCPLCSKVVAERGANWLYADYLKDITSGLRAHGVRPCIWDDMIMKEPDELGVIPKDFVIWDWDYWDTDATPSSVMVWSEGKRVNKMELTNRITNMIPEILDSNGDLRSFYVSDFLRRKGFDVVTCSSSRSHGDAVFAGRHTAHSGNIIAGARKCAELGLLGTCVTSWAVRLPNYETQEPWIMLAPLTIQHPLVPADSLLLIVSSILFGTEDRGFFDALDDVGFPFPFTDKSTTGIMWTGMKDSRPAPEGYIRNLISTWKKDSLWEANVRVVEQAGDRICSGIDKVDRFLPQATRGFESIYAWSVAGNFQLWQSRIAQAIIEKADGENRNKADQWVEQIAELKRAYRGWAEEWMTPRSALHNSGLIYDAIQEYFR